MKEKMEERKGNKKENEEQGVSRYLGSESVKNLKFDKAIPCKHHAR